MRQGGAGASIDAPVSASGAVGIQQLAVSHEIEAAITNGRRSTAVDKFWLMTAFCDTESCVRKTNAVRYASIPQRVDGDLFKRFGLDL